jgi:hypothetical protein
MKYKISYRLLATLLAILLLIVLSVFLFYRPACENTNTEIIIVQEIQQQQQQQQPTYFGPATIAPRYARWALQALPPAFPVFGFPTGVPTRPLRELGGWRVNYGVI